MEKVIYQIKVTETEDGFRVEAAGERAKEMLKCGCIPLAACCCCSGSDKATDACCETEEKK